jgi:hypothetical protein
MRAVLLAGAFAAMSSVVHAQQLAAATQVGELKQLSIEQLSNVAVTSVTRTAQPLAKSAVAVVTSGEIASSGAGLPTPWSWA